MKQTQTQTQTQRIYNYMQRGGSLTALQALNMFGVLRLAARVAEIRKTQPVQSKRVKRGGKYVARYSM